ncbi:hypothetical protein HYV21_00255 [Candidatus Microgenomates bacterium]|nr:hypothetical protein [Candidatus Microgenomates bacterium]
MGLEGHRFLGPDSESRVVKIPGEVWDYQRMAEICGEILHELASNFSIAHPSREGIDFNTRVEIFKKGVKKDVPQGESRIASLPLEGVKIYFSRNSILRWPSGLEYPWGLSDILFLNEQGQVEGRGGVINQNAFARLNPRLIFEVDQLYTGEILSFVSGLPKSFPIEVDYEAVRQAIEVFREIGKATTSAFFIRQNFYLGDGEVSLWLAVKRQRPSWY